MPKKRKSKNPSRSGRAKLGTAVPAIFFVIGALSLHVHAAAPLADSLLAENQARFGAVQGDVGFLSQGATEWRIPQEGLPIESGDQIRTADESRVELRMSENVLWVLEPNTEVAAERADKRSGRLHLTAGALIGKVDSQRVPIQQHWEFSTPAALIGVRGTEFSIQFSPKDGTRLAVFEGLVEMQAAETAAGEEPIQRIAAGHEGLARRGKPLEIHQGLSAAVKPFYERRADLRIRMARHQQGWSYWNPQDRLELRKKIVPAVKKAKARPRPAPRRRASRPQRNTP